MRVWTIPEALPTIKRDQYMTHKQLQSFLYMKNACGTAIKYCRRNKGVSPKKLWEKCQKGFYMEWLIFALRMWEVLDSCTMHGRDFNTRRTNIKLANHIRSKVQYKEINKAILKYLKNV
jgi:hypothetical protein